VPSRRKPKPVFFAFDGQICDFKTDQRGGMMPIVAGDDSALADLRHRLGIWFSRPNQAGNPRIIDVAFASSANGYSNETYRVTLERAGKTETLILRLPPARESIFAKYDIGRQYTFMHALQDAPGVPMAACRWLEPDPSVLGRPFFLVDHTDGQIPSDEPMYLRGGWVIDASDEERSALWQSSVDALVALSKVRWSGAQLAAVDWLDRGRSRTELHLELIASWAAWGSAGLPHAEPPLLRELGKWLKSNRPADGEPGVVWGDARFGNIIYRDFKAVALLDWELAVIGDPGIDLSYMLVMHRINDNQIKVNGKTAPRNSGFWNDADTIEYYNRHAAKPLRHIRYYWLLNGYKLLCIIQGVARALLKHGVMDEEQAGGFRKYEYLYCDLELVFGHEDHSALFE
jgi:aminoglycoside phosphotransferase (APT) family kinase protein